jgi:hypothetical protein
LRDQQLRKDICPVNVALTSYVLCKYKKKKRNRPKRGKGTNTSHSQTLRECTFFLPTQLGTLNSPCIYLSFAQKGK